ncbi:hypothetical protein OCF14_08925 [Bacillus cereus]|nr:hypothetical protein [Bacillus cereus]
MVERGGTFVIYYLEADKVKTESAIKELEIRLGVSNKKVFGIQSNTVLNIHLF